ncbi:serine protease [Variovorax sp. J22R115]|uniref:trypsin-like serine peptidase n=1 Tax=Variovorax sp. J22R115 TaxID=3053509 RepID=UPI00257904BD|nr:trypsin-like peptidase domain-containing protein [Variovorax sp. J22R115]MDM0053521.1 trypsin-like peptidase domain-containing protein [Variovorax sp. J22R115]
MTREIGGQDWSAADAWRQRFGMMSASAPSFESALESNQEIADAAGAPEDRIKRAREEMRRIVQEHFGGDAALLAAVDSAKVTSEQAMNVLRDAQRAPTSAEYGSLEAIVAFDGTRPSFLVRDGDIDFESSYCTSPWKTTLKPRREQLAAFAACVGRIEVGEIGIGTAFLISPTLALSNRHVAQAIAQFGPSGITVKSDVYLDFGREHQGRESHDRRAVRKVLFAGKRLIAPPIDHEKLDLALLGVDASSSSEHRDRRLEFAPSVAEVDAGWMVATVGYPADWRQWVPTEFVNEYGELIAKLLEGEKGTKRFAPGQSGGMLAETANATGPRSAMHDATTINGNSGSPLAIIDGAAPLQAVGLHYGGQWAGQRANWAHVLAACANAEVTGGVDLRTALKQHDITL